MIKLLVATKETQGKRNNDFCFAEEGEIVVRGSECDGEAVDGRCGCKRAMCGVKTRTATTTMKVVELDIEPEDVKEQMKESLVKGGWASLMKPKEVEEMVNDSYKENVELAEYFGVGAIVEKRGDTFQSRRP